MLCCFPCNSRAAVCSDVTGGSVGRKVGGERKIVFIVPLVGLLRAMGAAHHCQDWGGKLLTSARSCTAEPLWVYVSLILIRSCCWNFVRMIVFIKILTDHKCLRHVTSVQINSKSDYIGLCINSPSVGLELWWPVWQSPGWVLGQHYC